YPLIPRSRASGVTRDEATSGASCFSERCGASSGDGAFAPPHHEGYQLALHRPGEIGKELVGQFLGRAVDQALAELGQLAADLRLDVVGQQRAAILVGERHRCAALGEAGNAALALTRDLVA